MSITERDERHESLGARRAPRSRVDRGRSLLLTAAGFACLGLAAAGAVLPVLPTTPLVLVAAACFARSSPRFYDRLLAHAIFGPIIREWREHRAIPLRIKVLATTAIVVAGGFSAIFAMPVVWARVLFVGILLAVIVWIWSFPHQGRAIRES